ncbi:MAG: DNA primase, partial [Geminicoccaceae bacterium]|nr:DNA primase [Geminicoccaceae bacterium]
AIDFVMATEGLGFTEALRRLADLTGIPAPLREPAAGPGRPPTEPLVAANETAARWFQGRLAAGEGRVARDYLAQRGVPPDLQHRFALGYAPDSRDGLVRALTAAGIPPAVQAEAGLVGLPEEGGSAYDRFRHRLMFPIRDQRGRLVGFGGRALGEARAKYLNTSETPIFHKGSLLYGFDLAAKPARERREIFIVEGYLDVIAMAGAGFENTTAPLGTAVSEEQLRLLWRHADEPYVCLDGDAAGLAAAMRMIRRALPIMAGGQTLRFIVLPSGEDPDSLLRASGRDALEQLVRAAVPLSRMIWQVELAAAPAETPEQIAGLRHRLLEYVRLAGDRSLQDGLRSHFDGLVYELRRAVNGRRAPDGRQPGRGRGDARGAAPGRPGWGGVGAARLASSLASRARDANLELLGAFLEQPALLDSFGEELAAVPFDHPDADTARRELLNWFAATDHLDAVDLRNHLTRYGFAVVVEQALQRFAVLTRTVDEEAGIDELLGRMLAGLRLRAARRDEAEAFAGDIGGGDTDELAGRRFDRLLNDRTDDES